MGGPVSSLGEEVGKGSTAVGGQRDEQERWEVKAAACKLQKIRALPIVHILFDRFYLTDFMFYFTDYNRH